MVVESRHAVSKPLYAARCRASTCRNQLIARFELVKIWSTNSIRIQSRRGADAPLQLKLKRLSPAF
jgi:hypothetical protein